MQAVLDAGRRTLTLPRRLVPVVMMLGTRGSIGNDPATLRGLAELERAGIAPDRRLHPLAADMLTIVTDPQRVITVESNRGASTSISTIWVRRRSAVLGRPAGRDFFQLGPVEVGLLPFHLAQLVGVRLHPDPPFSGSVTAPADLLDSLAGAWTDDPSRAVAALVGDGIDRTWAQRLALAHRHRTARWRIASLWVDHDGSAGDEEIVVLDAGPAGFWQILTDGSGMGQITFATRRFVDVLELLQAAGSLS